MSDLIARTHAYAARLFAMVDAGTESGHNVMAWLIADTLALSLEESTPPDVADELQAMACQWATVRRRALLAEAALQRDPVPDDAAELLESGDEQA